jgi:hypothetical protein
MCDETEFICIKCSETYKIHLAENKKCRNKKRNEYIRANYAHDVIQSSFLEEMAENEAKCKATTKVERSADVELLCWSCVAASMTTSALGSGKRQED